MNFHVGQKVVCIDDNFSRKFVTNPVMSKIYTLREVYPFADGIGVLLDEIRNEPRQWSDDYGEPGFRASRFRPVVEKKTDISIFTEMLKPRVLVRSLD